MGEICGILAFSEIAKYTSDCWFVYTQVTKTGVFRGENPHPAGFLSGKAHQALCAVLRHSPAGRSGGRPRVHPSHAGPRTGGYHAGR